MYLSFTGYKKYKGCPRAYWHEYVHHTPIPPDNCVGSLFGSVIGVVFENFYTNRMWRCSDPTEALSALVKDVAKTVIQKELKKGRTVNWKDRRMRNIPRSLDELVASVREFVPNGLRIICKNRLLGTNARAEVKLDHLIGGHTIGGRCDFLMQRIAPLGDTILVDGKGSVHRDKYVDQTQLQMYSMLHRRKYGRLPDQVAFLFWRSPPEQAMDWYTPTIESVEELEANVLETMGSIEKRMRLPMSPQAFPVKPSPGKCKLCSYLSVCPDGTAMTSENPPPVSSSSGVEDVTLD